MDKQIINKLLDLNFNITSKGFNYWIDAIKINIKDNILKRQTRKNQIIWKTKHQNKTKR